MYLSIKWLKEFTPYDGDIEKLSHVLTMLGLEVEEIFNPFEEIKDIVVGYVVSCEKHPNADKLKLCKVDIGSGEPLPVVCGAPNVGKGQYVAFAPVGYKLPGGIEIKKTKLRGEVSYGMICSERELGLSNDHSGIMVLDSVYTPGTKLIDALDLDTVVFDIGITPNRADCLSILGIAREVSAYFNLPLNLPPSPIENIEEDQIAHIDIEIEDPDDCPLYCARIIEDVKIHPSPAWMRHRLRAMGLRPINNVVDITNYVLLEFGHPLHAFDKDLLKGNKIRVARPKDRLTFKTLDEQQHAITIDDLLIWDSEDPVALAGIMGGYDSEINENTKNVLLECAVFNSSLIRRTARRLGISSDAAYRFERGVDQLGADRAIDRAAYLIHRFAGGKVLKGVVKNEAKKFIPSSISFRPKRAISLLSIDADSQFCLNALEKLNCSVEKIDDSTYNVIPPSYRLDLEREIDLIEEVGRFYGLEKIPSKLPNISKTEKEIKILDEATYKFLNKVRQWARGIGLQECVTYSFVDKDELLLLGEDEQKMIPVANPLTKDQDTMRTILCIGLLNSLKINTSRLNRDLHLFEIGKVFLKDTEKETTALEKNKLAILLHGNRYPVTWANQKSPWDFYDIKGIIEDFTTVFGLNDNVLYKAASNEPFLDYGLNIFVDGNYVGFIGSFKKSLFKTYNVKSDVFLGELDLDIIFKCYENKKIMFNAWSKFPPVFRDMTVVCPDDVTFEMIKQTLSDMKTSILEEVNFIDLYIPEDKKEKRITLRMTYRDPNRTLTDKEVDKVHGKIGEYLINNLPVRFP